MERISQLEPIGAEGTVLTSNGAGRAAVWMGPAYLGNCGMRTYVPGSAGGTLLNMMSKSVHQVADDVAAVQFAIPNWQGTSEAGPGAASTVTATVEFETGRRWRLTLAGATSMSIPDGGMIWTDPLPWVIPRGQRFNVYLYRTNAVGCVYTPNVQDHGLGELIEYNVGVDKTASGTIDPTQTAPWAGPCGIRGLMTRPSVCLMGDSIVTGETDTSDGSGGLSYARVLQNAGIAWQNLGIGGTGANGFLSGGHTHRVALASLCSHLIQEYGTNDLALGDTQMRADLNSINALMPAAQKKFLTTITPRTTGSWADLAGQVAIAQQGVIDSNNAWRLTVPTGFTGCFDVANVLKYPGTSKWKFPGYTADGLHPSATAYAAIVSSGIITPSSFFPSS